MSSKQMQRRGSDHQPTSVDGKQRKPDLAKHWSSPAWRPSYSLFCSKRMHPKTTEPTRILTFWKMWTTTRWLLMRAPTWISRSVTAATAASFLERAASTDPGITGGRAVVSRCLGIATCILLTTSPIRFPCRSRVDLIRPVTIFCVTTGCHNQCYPHQEPVPLTSSLVVKSLLVLQAILLGRG